MRVLSGNHVRSNGLAHVYVPVPRGSSVDQLLGGGYRAGSAWLGLANDPSWPRVERANEP